MCLYQTPRWVWTPAHLLPSLLLCLRCLLLRLLLRLLLLGCCCCLRLLKGEAGALGLLLLLLAGCLLVRCQGRVHLVVLKEGGRGGQAHVSREDMYGKHTAPEGVHRRQAFCGKQHMRVWRCWWCRQHDMLQCWDQAASRPPRRVDAVPGGVHEEHVLLLVVSLLLSQLLPPAPLVGGVCMPAMAAGYCCFHPRWISHISCMVWHSRSQLACNWRLPTSCSSALVARPAPMAVAAAVTNTAFTAICQRM